jgi:hypothetical protein
VWSPSTDLVDYAMPGVPLPVNVLEIPNQFSVDSSPGRLRVDYDVLNGIVPVGSVDGTFTLASDGAGRYRVERLDTDRYPSIGVYQYRRGRRVEVLAQQDSAGVWSAFPLVPAVTDTVATAVDGAGELAADVGRAVRDVWERW